MQPQPPRPLPTCAARRRTRAFTLVETALIVCVMGAVLAAAVPTFLRTVQSSKISEASTQLAVLYRGAASYYATPRPSASSGQVFCLPAGAGPTPATPSVNPVDVDFADASAPGSATWIALGFTGQGPLRYRYTYAPKQSGCDLPVPSPAAVVLRAEGDLDGDGAYSKFERSASLASPGELSPDPLLRVLDRVE